jgi:hypothetical protein
MLIAIIFGEMAIDFGEMAIQRNDLSVKWTIQRNGFGERSL